MSAGRCNIRGLQGQGGGPEKGWHVAREQHSCNRRHVEVGSPAVDRDALVADNSYKPIFTS